MQKCVGDGPLLEGTGWPPPMGEGVLKCKKLSLIIPIQDNKPGLERKTQVVARREAQETLSGASQYFVSWSPAALKPGTRWQGGGGGGAGAWDRVAPVPGPPARVGAASAQWASGGRGSWAGGLGPEVGPAP